MKRRQLNFQRSATLALLALLLAACTTINNPASYDLTNEDGIRSAYEALSREKIDDLNDYCFTDVDGFVDVALVGFFLHDLGCSFEQAIVLNQLGPIDEMTPLALQHNGWEDSTNREKLAQTWIEEAILANFSIIRRENEDFLRQDTPVFTPPMIETQSDGVIRMDVWLREPSGMLPETGYVLAHVMIDSDGNLIANEKGERFTVQIGMEPPPVDVVKTPVAVVDTPAASTPTAVSSAAPTATPNDGTAEQIAATPFALQPDMPWIVMANFNGIFAANGDGSSITQLSEDLIAYGQNKLLAAISPDGQWLAYVNALAETDPILMLMHLRTQTERTVTPLLSEISLPPDAVRLTV